ncbi:hypothetical protein LCGC14_0525060 [marine sediment metagenome]|uniref:Uncharacterized protein n=1 Tax=marine sediment metagenome TaxID=412755 RepID=A0A0F9V5F8_9ZZZZ
MTCSPLSPPIEVAINIRRSDVPPHPARLTFGPLALNASRRPVGGGVIGDFGGLQEEVLGLFEFGKFGIEPFQQGEHPLFAVGDLRGDHCSGISDPVDLVL